MSDLRDAAQQALEAWDGGDVKWFANGYQVMDALRAALAEEALQRLTDVHQEMEAALEQPEDPMREAKALAQAYENGWNAAQPLEQPEQEPTWRLSCGCPSQHGGIPAEWPETTREGDPAVAYGVVCEKHWHEYEARCPNCASLESQNTELDRKLAELSERHLTDEVIADLWHANGGFHHHFARALERWLKGQA